MEALLIGYARVSTDEQDLTAQRDALISLGVGAERIYVDHGLEGWAWTWRFTRRRSSVGGSALGNATHTSPSARPDTTSEHVSTRDSSMTTPAPMGVKSSGEGWTATTHELSGGASP